MDGEFCHRDFWKIMMDALHNIIPKSIVEVLNRLENDEDNRYSWKLTRNQDSLSLTVSCKLPTKTPNKAKDDSEVPTRFCETSETSSEEEKLSLCVGSF